MHAFSSPAAVAILFLFMGAAGAAPEEQGNTAVGFVQSIHGNWTDTVNKMNLVHGGTILRHARIVPDQPIVEDASIEIFLLNGEVIQRDCRLGACGTSIVIETKPDKRENDADFLERLKRILFDTPDTEVPAVTFGNMFWNLQKTNAPKKLRATQPCGFGPRATPCAAIDEPALFARKGGSTTWMAEAIYAAAKLILAEVKQADGETSPLAAWNLQDKTAGATAAENLLGGFRGILGSRGLGLGFGMSLSESDEPVRVLHAVNHGADRDSERDNIAYLCGSTQSGYRFCPERSGTLEPGLYANADVRAYLLDSIQARCLTATLEANSVAAKWVHQLDDDAQRTQLTERMSRQFEHEARTCRTAGAGTAPAPAGIQR